MRSPVFPGNNSPQQPEDARFNGGCIVRNYGGKQRTGIDALQLELGSQQRAKTQLDRTASDFAGAIELFAREYLPNTKSGFSVPVMVPRERKRSNRNNFGSKRQIYKAGRKPGFGINRNGNTDAT